MSFNLMPVEIKEYLLHFIIQDEPKKLSREPVKAWGRNLTKIALVNYELHSICSKKLSELKRIYALLNKYHVYQKEYENPPQYLTGKIFDPKGNPQLYDALLTGSTSVFAKSTFHKYSKEIESDIKEIVKLIPKSMNCIIGELRCRDEVPPLFAACVNENIPLHIVEFLLENGADSNSTLVVCGSPEPILSDLKINISNKERLSQIEQLFHKYGFKE